MGQYYKAINLDTFEWLDAHQYDNGIKIMEHSWLGNDFVGTIMKLLSEGGKWYKTRIVWCGDYAERIYGEQNLYDMCSPLGEDELEEGQIKLFEEINPLENLDKKNQKKSFIVNHTKKQYVKLSECEKDKYGVIHPLPLLTSMGGEEAGGDYKGKNMNLLGYWTTDIISVEFNEKELIKDGFEKIIPDFQEGQREGSNSENENNTYEKLCEWIKTQEVKDRLVLEQL